jgi:RimJ/RimL family protein N-acetyltransferase
MKKKQEQSSQESGRSTDVLLVPSRTPRSQAGYLFYWHVHHGGKKAGKVYITRSKEGSAFITVFLNKPMQGRGIGGVAFRLACELSDLPTIYAEVRRSNIPSQKALKKAGFSPFGRNASGEDILVWKKNSSA